MGRNSKLKVTLPKPANDRPRWTRVGVAGAVGLVIGVSWPTLAGMQVGPDLPGAKKSAAPPVAAVVSAPAPNVAPALAKVAPDPTVSHQQRVVVGKGAITKCFEKNRKLDSCGKLRIDRTLVPRLEQLGGCDAALGLDGTLEIAFDFDFRKKEIAVLRGKKSELPASTIRGVFACTSDYISDVELDKIPHKHTRYRVLYELAFYPPGTSANTPSDADARADEDTRSLAAVAWDTALVRDEPNTGDVVARLVRGTRVQLLSRRKDWYRVKIRGKEGWIYRGALGL